jgi:hypothetical protein
MNRADSCVISDSLSRQCCTSGRCEGLHMGRAILLLAFCLCASAWLEWKPLFGTFETNLPAKDGINATPGGAELV